MYRVLFLFTVLLLLFVYGCPMPLPEIKGEIKSKEVNDSTVVTGDFELYAPYDDVDSVNLTIYSKANEVILDTTVLVVNTSKKVSPNRYSNSLKLNIDSLSNIEKIYFVCPPYDVSPESYNFPSDFNHGLYLALGTSFFDKSSHPPFVRDVPENSKLMFGLGYLARFRRFSFSANSNIYAGTLNDPDDKYLHDLLNLEFRYLAKDRFNWQPIPVLKANYSKFKIFYGDNHFLKYSVGVGFGLMVEKKFQIISYTYNTSYNGYHKIEALFAMVSSYDNKVGTKYMIFHGKDLKMFSISLVIEGFDNQMRYPNKQNFIHKTLSAGIFAPFYLLFKGIDLIAKD